MAILHEETLEKNSGSKLEGKIRWHNNYDKKDTGYGLLQHTIAETGCGMNLNTGQLPTYKSLFPVLRTQTTCIRLLKNQKISLKLY